MKTANCLPPRSEQPAKNIEVEQKLLPEQLYDGAEEGGFTVGVGACEGKAAAVAGVRCGWWRRRRFEGVDVGDGIRTRG